MKDRRHRRRSRLCRASCRACPPPSHTHTHTHTHALRYLSQPAIHLIEAVQLYANSLTHYENAPSPYLYPVYGLGGLPESF